MITETLYSVRWEKKKKIQKNQPVCIVDVEKFQMNHIAMVLKKTSFDGTEKNCRTTYDEQVKTIYDHGINLKDAEKLYSGAWFCDVGGEI